MVSDDYAFRFGGIGRLYGTKSLQTLAASHVAVVGLGGVGSWAAEALARSGVGTLTLIDYDDICLSNINRQLPATQEQVGKLKIDVLKNRFLSINPELKIHLKDKGFDPSSCTDLFDGGFNLVVDAIDDLPNKCLLIAECQKREISLVTTGGAGGRRDPSLIRIADLSQSFQDPLLARVRKVLRQEYGYSKNEDDLFHVPTVFSTERPYYPTADGCVVQSSAKDKKPKGPLDCNTGYGTATFVTGAYGFAAASVAVQILVDKNS